VYNLQNLIADKQIDFTKEPLFLGSGRNIIRLDLNVEQWIQKATDRALGLTWFKHDFSYTQDAKDFEQLTPELKVLYLKNLKFQQFLDSLATRTVTEVFKPVTTNPQLESWWTIHGFQEDIHHQSYAELIKALPVNSTKIFDDIMINPHILKRGKIIVNCFEDTIVHNAKMSLQLEDYNVEDHKRSIIKSLYALNILENGLFQTSFITTFAFAENGIMESSGKSMGKIAKDEDNHAAMTVYLINRLKKNDDWKYLFKELEEEVTGMYLNAYEADKLWIEYLFEEHARLLGLSDKVLLEYSTYNIHKAMAAVGHPQFVEKINNNPCSWAVKYTKTSNLQVALNESDGVNYLLGALNKDMTESDWKGLK